jgi:fatty-acyl-CoA synthase|tara:strand:- start:4177 stop:5709 length:1533 start_codon:yes stop_codon:yes gene_type:complete
MSSPSYDWIAHHALVRGDKLAVHDLDSGRKFTYAEMNDRTSRLATALRSEFNIERGDRVAVLAENDSNTLEVQFACWKLGAIFVPLNWRLTIPELEYIVGDAEPTVLFHDDPLSGQSIKLAQICNISHRVTWGRSIEDAAAYEEVLALHEPMDTCVECTHDDPVTIMYTSGTTGRPKGVIITQGMTFWNAVNCVEFYSLGESMINIVFLPLFHTGGLNVFTNPAFHFGGTNLVMKTFEPSKALALLTDPEIAVTHLIGVPANWLFMSQVPEFKDASFPTIIAPCVGGSPTPVPLIEAWAGKGLPLQQAFGMTETSPLVLALPSDKCTEKIGSAGLPGMHTAVRIVTEDGREAEVGENGELWCKGPNITPGYWNNPQATAESFEDGWLKTGDAARRDEDGFYYIVDRWKDMYISGGENVYPAEVESVIYQLPQIGEVAVIGIPNEKWVEAGRAIVVVKPGESVTESEIINHCRENLARFKVPQSVIFIDEIPHNATGKVLKRELRDQHSDA